MQRCARGLFAAVGAGFGSVGVALAPAAPPKESASTPVSAQTLPVLKSKVLRNIPVEFEPSKDVSHGLCSTIGHTPLLELDSLNELTGCRIVLKAEHLNPGGSVKDRTAYNIISAYADAGQIQPGDMIVEGTGGNTGVGMALVAAAKGYKCYFTMPNHVSNEKVEMMKSFGAEVEICPVVPFTDPRHYYQRAKHIAETTPGAVWGNQFENLSNMNVHYKTTGPEIWKQSGHKVRSRMSSFAELS
jgi:cysteine synthase A